MVSLENQLVDFIKTPQLNLESFSGIPDFVLPKIEISEALILTLEEKLSLPGNSILGKKLETFLEVILEFSERYEVITSNLQIIHEKQTLGELDFLIYDCFKHKPLHVEMVYKLYTLDPEFSDHEMLIGPNRKDRFLYKLQKLKNKQFPLLYSEEVNSYLKKHQLKAKNIEQQLFFKARLFGNCEDLPLPYPIQELHNYYSFSSFQKKDWKNCQFAIPSKVYWMCDSASNKNWITYAQLLKELRPAMEANRSKLVWMKTETGAYDSFFVVWW